MSLKNNFVELLEDIASQLKYNKEEKRHFAKETEENLC